MREFNKCNLFKYKINLLYPQGQYNYIYDDILMMNPLYLQYTLTIIKRKRERTITKMILISQEINKNNATPTDQERNRCANVTTFK